MATNNLDPAVQKSDSLHLHCCVPQCSNDTRYGGASLSFHTIPKDLVLRKQWISKIRRDPGKFFNITSRTRVCSSHFKESEIYRTPCGKRFLRKSTVPSKFAWSANKSPRHPLERMRVDKQNSTPEPRLSESLDNPLSLDHSYSRAALSMNEQLQAAKEEIRKLKLTVSELTIERFGINRFSASNEMVRYYTGFVSYEMFINFFHALKNEASSVPLWSTVRESVREGQTDSLNFSANRRKLPLADELFLFLFRLRQGNDELDISVRFGISVSSTSSVIITWGNFLYFALGNIPIWPCKTIIDANRPKCFHEKGYGNTRVIIDCTEVFVQVPSSLLLQSELFSNYKSHTTFKGLIGIAPHGPVTFVSSLYGGCISDRSITVRSGLLDLLDSGDSIMADKGFTISKLVEERGVSLNIPPFNFNGRFTAEEAAKTQKIASLRIHVERAIRRIKEYQILSNVIPLTLAVTINQLWTVSCLLTNFYGALCQDFEKQS